MEEARTLRVRASSITEDPPSAPMDDGRPQSSGLDQVELGERRDAVVEADFFGNLAVPETQYRRAREGQLPTGPGGQRADEAEPAPNFDPSRRPTATPTNDQNQ